MKKSSLNLIIIILIFFSLCTSLNDVNIKVDQSEKKIIFEDLTQVDSTEIDDWIAIENLSKFKRNEHKSSNTNPTRVIEYNPMNKSEKVIAEKQSRITNFSPQVKEFRGILDEEDNIIEKEKLHVSYVFPPDDRQKIISTSSFPWRTICKLYITAQNGSRYICSGSIIDNFHVLTCGHCVYLHDAGGWADQIEVIPGMTEYEQPFGSAYTTYYRSYTGWTQDEMYQHDWALLTLDRSLGIFTGWMGRQTDDSSSSIYTGTLNTAGYPGDLDYGENMYFDADSGDRADEYNHWYWMDTAGGQSGSPIWSYDGEDRYILTILAYEYVGGVDANFGTRLNSDKYNQLNSWLSDDAATPPNDKAELLEGDSYSSFNSDEVVAGKTDFEIYFDIKNTGTASASNFQVRFYASEDYNISPTDYLIGTKEIGNLQPFNSINGDWYGVFPNTIPKGYYYIGFIIDPEDSIEELDENNNEGLIGYSGIDVTVPLPQFNWIPVIFGVLAFVGLTSVILLIIRSTTRNIPDLDYRNFNYEPFESNQIKSFEEKASMPQMKEIPKYCIRCGTKIIEGSIYCHKCGMDLRNFIN